MFHLLQFLFLLLLHFLFHLFNVLIRIGEWNFLCLPASARTLVHQIIRKDLRVVRRLLQVFHLARDLRRAVSVVGLVGVLAAGYRGWDAGGADQIHRDRIQPVVYRRLSWLNFISGELHHRRRLRQHFHLLAVVLRDDFIICLLLLLRIVLRRLTNRNFPDG